MRIDICIKLLEQAEPVVVRIVHIFMERPALALEHIAAVNSIHKLQQLGDVLLRVLAQITERFLDTEFFKLFLQAIICHFEFLL